MTRFAALVVAIAALVAAPVSAGEFNKVVNLGEKAPTFKALPGTDDKSLSLDDLKNDVVVVVITCNHCPVAIAYEDRMIEFAKKYKGKVDVVAINVNTNDNDKLDKMKERAKEKGFNFPYLYDESQSIAKALGAKVTPEFFVLDKSRKIAYMGAFDDNMKTEKVTKKYVESAVDTLLAGKKVEMGETKPFGCGVQYSKK